MLARDHARRTPRDELCEELYLRIQAGSVRCGVIGLGFIGSVLIDALIEAGLASRGFDRSSEAVSRLLHGRHSHPPDVDFDCGIDCDVINHCDVIFVAVRNPVVDDAVVDEPLDSAARLIGRHRRRPCLVILESTVMPGETRRFGGDIGAGDDDGLFVAHAPERLSAGQSHRELRSMPHLVAGLDAHATRLATAMLGKLCDHVVAVSSPEVSELSKLYENAFLSVNIALTAEIARVAMGMGVRAQEVCRAAATKTRGFMSFFPGAGPGGHCLPTDLVLLTQCARNQGWEPEVLAGAIVANMNSPRVVVERLELDLNESGIPIMNANVLIVGVGFKADFPDTAHSPAIDVVRALRRRGALISYVDSRNPHFAVDGEAVPTVTPEAVSDRHFDAAVLLSGEPTLPEECMLRACTCVLDAGGSRWPRPVVIGIRTL